MLFCIASRKSLQFRHRFCILFMFQIDKEIAKAFSNKPTLKKPGAPAPTAPVAPGLAAPAEPIKGAQKGKL